MTNTLLYPVPVPDAVIHYDIRAVSGVSRAACGIDNRIGDGGLQWKGTNNRNEPTCEDCLDKIDALAMHGGDVIMTEKDFDEDDRVVRLVRRALDEDDLQNDADFKSWHKEVTLDALREHQRSLRSTPQPINATVDTLAVKRAVQDAVKEGVFGFDEKQLRGQIHRVLNDRLRRDVGIALREHDDNQQIKLSGLINSVLKRTLNEKLAEASYLVGVDFTKSEAVKAIIKDAAKEGATEVIDHDDLEEIVREVMAEIMKDNPVQFVQNVYSPQELDASEVYRSTKQVLEAKKPAVMFDRMNHQELGRWASANDLVEEWSWDTELVRGALKLRQEKGRLSYPQQFPKTGV